MFETIAVIIRFPFYLLLLLLIASVGILLVCLWLYFIAFLIGLLIVLYPFWLVVVFLWAVLTNDKEKLELLNPWNVYPFWFLLVFLSSFTNPDKVVEWLADSKMGIGAMLKAVPAIWYAARMCYRLANKFLVGS